MLLKNGANVDAKDTDLWTPLFYASRNGKLEFLAYIALEWHETY